ncbi:O-acetylhomoserine aminocarboxypropyltransferase/cysteine synthase family protein, partial [Peptostreptococcus porci]|uniref:O-acetylhomoserine aminocarboxypropyltransferase/cysteine synthase family protein n=1 Tax=Peptostreptococcus porci TaxID=2652282 RepID=UPI002A837DE2
DHIVALSNLYGGTVSFFTNTVKRYGIDVTFVPVNAPDEVIQEAIQENTKVVYGETIGNPRVEVLDIERIANVAHKNGVPLVIDNTFATPILCRPFEFGADIVLHSTTKYIDGHARALGGIVVDGGKFDWNNGKFSDFVEPDPSYHGLSFVETFGNAAFSVKARVAYIRDIGFVQAPFNAFLTTLGLETLALRIERHSSNAQKIAEYLESHDKVEWVSYPGLKSNPTYELKQKYLPKGASGVIAFGVKGSADDAKKFIDNLEVFSLVTHVADAKSCVIHPSSTTHRQLSKEQLEKGGITETLVRLSVGIEDIEDLLADIENALSKL